jgi:hypothetical protein
LDVTRHGQALSFRGGCPVPAQYGRSGEGQVRIPDLGNRARIEWLLRGNRYGEEIARLQQAESLAKKALEAVKPGLGGAVTSDLKVSFFSGTMLNRSDLDLLPPITESARDPRKLAEACHQGQRSRLYPGNSSRYPTHENNAGVDGQAGRPGAS